MIDIIVVIIQAVIVSCMIVYGIMQQRALNQLNRTIEEKEKRHTEERQQLLDRIQAPSFDHLKQAEVRIIKAQKEEPAVKYDLV